MHCITFTFSQCFMHFRCVFTMLKSCVLVGLDQAEPMVFLLFYVKQLCIFHAYVPFFFSILLILICTWYYFACLCPSLSFFWLVCFMAPKKSKSILSRNPLHSEAASTFDSTPSHVRFRDEKACQDFSENFSRQGIHLKCQVILSDFFDTDLPTVIYSRVGSHFMASQSLVPS